MTPPQAQRPALAFRLVHRDIQQRHLINADGDLACIRLFDRIILIMFCGTDLHKMERVAGLRIARFREQESLVRYPRSFEAGCQCGVHSVAKKFHRTPIAAGLLYAVVVHVGTPHNGNIAACIHGNRRIAEPDPFPHGGSGLGINCHPSQ